MQITYAQIVNTANMANRIANIKMPMKDSIKVALLFNQLRRHEEAYHKAEAEVRLKYRMDDPECPKELKLEGEREIAEAQNVRVVIDFEPIDIPDTNEQVEPVVFFLSLWMWNLPAEGGESNGSS